MSDADVPMTLGDIRILLGTNPLAKAQAESIAKSRIIRELETALAALNGTGEEDAAQRKGQGVSLDQEASKAEVQATQASQEE